MKIVQLVPSITYGDAVSNDVFAIHKVLKKSGYNAQIYVYGYANIRDESLEEEIRLFSEIPELTEDDILIYHMAIASDMSQFVMKQKCIKVMRYHNITPPVFFDGYNDAAVNACQEGLRQVKQMYDTFDYSIPDSEFNKNDLIQYGYTCEQYVVPVVIPFDDYKQEIDQDIYDKYNDGKTNILFVGRFAPNKKWEDIIECFCLYKKYWNSNSRLIMVGKYDENDLYYRKLARYIEVLDDDGICTTGHLSFAGILACYKAADLLLCMSEHEGFCVPIVEAMLFHKPIVAYQAAAVPETIGTGAMVVREKNTLEIAGIINYILKNQVFRNNLISRQDERLKDFDSEKIEKKFLFAIEKLIKQKESGENQA